MWRLHQSEWSYRVWRVTWLLTLLCPILLLLLFVHLSLFFFFQSKWFYDVWKTAWVLELLYPPSSSSIFLIVAVVVLRLRLLLLLLRCLLLEFSFFYVCHFLFLFFFSFLFWLFHTIHWREPLPKACCTLTRWEGSVRDAQHVLLVLTQVIAVGAASLSRVAHTLIRQSVGGVLPLDLNSWLWARFHNHQTTFPLLPNYR